MDTELYSIERRLIALETKFAYQEKTIAELNDVIIDQSRSITELERRMKVLDAQTAAAGAAREMPAERPPHY